MKFNQVLNNFTAGQWSPRMLANTNVEQYAKACKTLQNMFVMKQGGAFKRPGLLFQSFAASPTQETFLNANNGLFMIPWTLSDGAKYLVVCDNGLPDGRWFVWDVSNNTFFNYITATTDSQFASNSMQNTHYAQVGDILYITGGGENLWPRRILLSTVAPVRLELVLEEFAFAGTYYKGVPFYEPNVLGLNGTITSSGTVGAITLTASLPIFDSSMVRTGALDGTYLKLTSGGVTGVVQITGYTSTTVVNGITQKTLPIAGAYGLAAGTSWEISAWNPTYGFPTSVVAHSERLFWGGQVGSKTKNANVVWGSAMGYPEEMMEIPLADDPSFTTYASDNSRPFTFYPTASEGSRVRCLAGSKSLFIGAEKNEIVGRGIQNAIGPNDITLDSSTSFGASTVQPVKADSYTTYVQRDGKTIRDIIYSYENEQYKAVDISFFSDSLFIGKTIKQLVSGIVNGTTVMLARLSDGSLVMGSLDRDQGVVAWGSLVVGGTNVTVVHMAVVPSANSDLSDGIFLLVRRLINGVYKVYLEKMAAIYEASTYTSGSGNFFYYMDSLRIVSSPGSAAISAPHLAGETVHVFGDGNYLGTKVISSGGSLVLDAVYSEVIFGLGYSHRLVPAPIKTNTQFGNSSGMIHKVSSLYINFWNTIAATYGDPERNEFYDIEFRSSTVVASTSIPLFTGEKRVQFPPGYSREKQVEIKGSLPFPCNVLSIVAEGVAYD